MESTTLRFIEQFEQPVTRGYLTKKVLRELNEKGVKVIYPTTAYNLYGTMIEQFCQTINIFFDPVQVEGFLDYIILHTMRHMKFGLHGYYFGIYKTTEETFQMTDRYIKHCVQQFQREVLSVNVIPCDIIAKHYKT